MRKNLAILLWILVSAGSPKGAQSIFDPEQNTWTLTNGWIRAVFQLTQEGYFHAVSLSDLRARDHWTASPNKPMTPIRLQIGSDMFDARRQYSLIAQFAQFAAPSGMRQTIVLQDLNRTAQITLAFELYDEQPLLRYELRYKNLTASTTYIRSADMLPWTFADEGKRYTTLRVNQWSVLGPGNFEAVETVLDPDGAAAEIYSGAQGEQCGWLAVRDNNNRGLFAGWEFDGRSRTTVRQTGGLLDFASSVLDLNHPVEPSDSFSVPAGFVGLFHGDFDEAAYRTHGFVNSVLASKNLPDLKTFPYVSWDSWAYEHRIDESGLRRSAEIAAALGVELFIVDLGWARSIGDWHADPMKFPSGLAALSEHVHSLGMKFGLHFALTEADPNSPVLQANPDWTSSQNDNYFGAASLCLSNRPAKEWLIEQGIRMIDEYKVDWILQDGENMVKRCTKSTHTHDPADSNYENAVNGINAVVLAIQKARPQVHWENCENGGNMMTFNMARMYATSITSDAAGSLSSRRAVYGATYPFPPRFAGRYMPESDGLNSYATHSYRFGGNWALMNRLTELTAEQRGFLKQQIDNYKNQRADIATGRVFHHAAPASDGTDAIQSYNAGTDRSLAVVTRAESSGPSYLFRPKGLNPDQWYTVSFEVDSSVYSATGAQLMSDGVRVSLPAPYSSDVVHIRAQ